MSRWLQANYKRKAKDSYLSHVNEALKAIHMIDDQLPHVDYKRLKACLELCENILEDLELMQRAVDSGSKTIIDADYVKTNMEFVKSVIPKLQEEIQRDEAQFAIDKKSDKAYSLIVSGKVKPGDKNYDQVMEDVILLPENSSSLIYNGTIKPDNPYYEKILEDMLPHSAEHLIDNNIITKDNPYYEKVLEAKEQFIKATPFINRSGK